MTEPSPQPSHQPSPQSSPEPTPGSPVGSDLAGALEAVEAFVLGEAPHLTRVQVSERAGVPVAEAEALWRLLGFAHTADDEVVFTDSDVEALRLAHDLRELGVLADDTTAALVRTWGRSFARLADWQTSLLTRVAAERTGADPAQTYAELAGEVLPRVDRLQSYVWRRHLSAAASRLLAVASPDSPTQRLAVVFVDIVGFTSRSRTLAEGELVGWIEAFEDTCTAVVTDHGGHVIKTIGDEVLLVADDPVAAAEIALDLVARGADEEDPFPQVRAGLAYGDVVARLGDVFGPTVNVAARLTSLARPGSVLVDTGAHEALGAGEEDDDHGDPAGGGEPRAYRFRRLRRVSVKGYSHLQAYALRRG